MGMCGDIAIHDKVDGNPHAHIMLTTRDVSSDGFGQKNREWNNRENTEIWRGEWAQTQNQALEQAGVSETVDHRSYERQGKAQIPTIHLGTSAKQIERRGEQSERGRYNEEVRTINAEYINSVEAVREAQGLKDNRAGAELSKEQTAQETRLNARDETPVEKAEEQKPSPIEKIEPGASHAEAHPTAEQIAGEINDLKDEYIRLELKIYGQQNITSNANSEIMRLEGQIEAIKENVQNIDRYAKRAVELKTERSTLGIFAGRRKRELDGQIKQIEQSKTQTTNTLQRDYGITPDQSTTKIQSLQRQANEKKAAVSRDTTPTASLREQQAVIFERYRQALEIAATHPEKDRISELTANKTKTTSQRSIGERIAAGTAESKLYNLAHQVNDSRTQTHKIYRDRS
jgi:archaellum component FlaC